MVEVVDLKTRKHAINESVVETLEEALKLARGGELVNVAIAGMTADGCAFAQWSRSDKFAEMLGAVARMQHRLNMQQDEA